MQSGLPCMVKRKFGTQKPDIRIDLVERSVAVNPDIVLVNPRSPVLVYIFTLPSF